MGSSTRCNTTSKYSSTVKCKIYPWEREFSDDEASEGARECFEVTERGKIVKNQFVFFGKRRTHIYTFSQRIGYREITIINSCYAALFAICRTTEAAKMKKRVEKSWENPFPSVHTSSNKKSEGNFLLNSHDKSLEIVWMLHCTKSSIKTDLNTVKKI